MKSLKIISTQAIVPFTVSDFASPISHENFSNPSIRLLNERNEYKTLKRVHCVNRMNRIRMDSESQSNIINDN